VTPWWSLGEARATLAGSDRAFALATLESCVPGPGSAPAVHAAVLPSGKGALVVLRWRSMRSAADRCDRPQIQCGLFSRAVVLGELASTTRILPPNLDPAWGDGGTATTAHLSQSGSAPGCMAGFLWPSPARRSLRPRIFPCRHPQAGPVGIPRARACGAKIHGLTGRSAALALRPRLAGFGSVPSSRP